MYMVRLTLNMSRPFGSETAPRRAKLNGLHMDTFDLEHVKRSSVGHSEHFSQSETTLGFGCICRMHVGMFDREYVKVILGSFNAFFSKSGCNPINVHHVSNETLVLECVHVCAMCMRTFDLDHVKILGSFATLFSLFSILP